MARCRWNFDAIYDKITSFLLSLSLSSVPSITDANCIHTYKQHRAHKKNEILVFFSFILFYRSMYSATPVVSTIRWCSCFFYIKNGTVEQERERKRHRTVFYVVSVLAPYQARIYRFSFLLSTVTWSIFFYFCQQCLYTNTFLFVYICHCNMFH